MSSIEECADTSYFFSFFRNGYSGIGNGCHLENVAYDGWASFIVPENGLFNINLEIINPKLSDLKSISFYSGDCSDPEFITCLEINQDFQLHKRFYLPDHVNQTIFIQFVNGNLFTLEMDLCVSEEIEDVNAHNNCLDALFLSNEQMMCIDEIIVSNLGASTSEYWNECSGFCGNDIWFTFDVPESGRLKIECGTSGSSILLDGAFAIYKGDCDGLSLIACDDDSGLGSMPAYSISDSSLANQRLYLQFWSYNNLQEGEFSICIFESEPPIANSCEDAIFTIAVPKENCFTTQESIISLNTNTYSGLSPDCSHDISSDVWFKFEYKQGEELVFEFKQVQNNPLFDGKAALYRQACDSLVFVACNDDDGPANMPRFDLEELIEPEWDGDQNFFVQFWDFNQGVGGEVNYCLFDKSLVAVTSFEYEEIILYPNPAKEALKVTLPNTISGPVNWQIYGVEGQFLSQGIIRELNLSTFNLDIKDLEASTYILYVKSSKYQFAKKFVKF